MPHLPGHNRPFTSFLTQGMQNTNQNLNTMSMPNNQINFPKYPNPSNLPMQPGFQGVGNFYNKPMPKGPSEIPMQQDFMDMGGPKPTDKIQNPINIPMQQDFIGTGNIKPIEEPSLGNQIDFPNYLQEDPNYVAPPIGMQINPAEQLGAMGRGFDVNNDGVVDMYDATATILGTSPFDWMQSTGTGQFTFDDYIESFYQGGIEQGLYQNEGNLMYESATDWYENLYPGTQQVLQEQFNTPDYHMGETIDFYLEGGDSGSYMGDNPLYGLRYAPGAPTPGAATTANMGSYYDMGYGEESQQGFLENLMNYVHPSQSAPQQFTGGGGTGGQRARDLYYPGTSGGFAGVGQGLKGGGMQDMLKNMMG
tara:strand:- start:1538 stop:2629 length:1092 start_codon:yes stop_codon:yes gene_type:complete